MQDVTLLSDEALLRLVATRRTDAFDELYRRHAAAVCTVAWRVTADRADADDATQSAFMKLWSRAGSVEARGGSLRAWLVTVGRNAAVDRARRRNVSVAVAQADETMPAAEAGPEETLLQRDSQRDILRALNALDPDQRVVIELAYFGGLTQTEIAAETGTPLGTVKGRVRLAMRHLRRALSPAENLA